jgi:3-oxoacyl-[acyl-carrier protein] reductase
MNTLKDKVAIVTGSSRGIGAAIARALADRGARVVINYAGNKSLAEKVAREINANDTKAICVKADVSKKEEVKYLFDETIMHFGKADVLVNNAGVMVNTLIQDTTDEIFEKQININLKGVFYTLREASTRLADNGSIINVSSTVTRTIFPTYGVYSATKAAIQQLSRVFAKEVGKRGINVNCVLPGPTATDLFMEGKSEEVITQLAGSNAFKRLGKPSDIAKIVVFLASDESKWITGQNIGANGGMA